MRHQPIAVKLSHFVLFDPFGVEMTALLRVL